MVRMLPDLDGVVDEDSRWHGSKQEKGKWLEIDMRSNQTLI